MKRTFSTWLALLAFITVISAAAGKLYTSVKTTSDSAPETIVALQENAEMMPHPQSEAVSTPAAPLYSSNPKPKTASAADFTGTWIQMNTSVYDSSSVCPTITVENTGNVFTITGLYLSNSKVSGNFDSASGKIMIQPQVIYNHPTYGACALHTFSISGGKVTMNPTAPIEMWIDADGNMGMTQWGLFVESGAYAGAAFDAFSESVAGHPNGTFTSTPFSAETESVDAKVWVSQPNDGQVTVANMFGNAKPFNITLAPESAYIMSQFVMTADMYGDFYLFAANSTGKIDKNNYISVTPKEGGYSLSPWGIYCLASNTILVTTGKESSLTTDFKFRYPSVSANPMTGEGTLDNPWLVKTPEDLTYIALSTTTAQSYAEKYFKLANDIDLSGFKGHWFPIGTTQTAPFQGTFDGAGFTISGLSQDFSGAMSAGIFGFTGAKSTLKNINVTAISYSGCGKNIGGLVGYAMGEVSNCSVSGRIEATCNEIGGVVGYSTAPISECSFKGDLYGGIDIGGIVAYTTSSVSECSSNANVVLNTHVPYAAVNTHALGGIAAACYGTNAKPVTISGCVASGMVADLKASDHIGGIAGYINNTTISECLSNVQVVSTANVAVDGASPAAGGIAGYASKGEISDCMVAGAVNAASTEFAGGLCGYGGGASNWEVLFANNLVVGMVNTSSEWDKVGVIGSFFAKATLSISHSFYDAQTTGLDTIAVGHKSTEFLISGSLPEGFSTEKWSVTKGFYPVPKKFASTPEGNLASAPLLLSGNQTIRKVTSNFTVGLPENVKWGILSSDGIISDKSQGLEINGSNVTIQPVYSSDNLVAYLPDNTYRSYTIKVTPKLFQGEGTSERPFLINNVEDMMTLRQAVNVAKQPHSGDYFLLTTDLDFSTTPTFNGIASGDASLKFGGNFDGGNHKIKNFKLHGAVKGADGKLSQGTPYMGLFGICTKTSEIKNLIIDQSCEFTFYRYSGPVAGYTSGKITNCINYAPVHSWGVYNGGITGVAAQQTALISGCVNFGTISAVDGCVAGITGSNYGTISNSFNAGSVILTPNADISSQGANTNTGGIAGTNYGSIIVCENNGQIQGVASVGGIAGGNSNAEGDGSIVNCMNTAVVSGDGSDPKIGAIAGNLASFTSFIDNVYDRQFMPGGATGNGDVRGSEGLLTSEFNEYNLSGNWASTSGYPIPSSLGTIEDVKTAASVQIILSPLNVIDEIEEPAQLKGVSTSWSLSPAGPFSISGSILTAVLGNAESGEGVLKASTPFGTRSYDLRAVSKIFAGTGSESDPHLIPSPAEMIKLSDAVNSRMRSFAGHHFKITADLDFEDSALSPIGTQSTPFQGLINGSDHKISNLTISTASDYTGVVGFGGAVAAISNLSLDSTCSISGKAYVGSLAGRFDGSISGCRSFAKVGSTGNYVGGLVGYMAEGSSFSGCISSTEVNASGTYVGGLAGVLYGDASECSNTGTIKGKTTYIGGLCGSLRGCLSDCENSGEVSSVSGGNYIGGLAAMIESGSAMINCVNRGDLKNGKAYVGGLYGSTPTSSGAMRENGAIITNCRNYGAVTGSGTNIGGLAGLMGAGHHLYGCENHGAVLATGGNTTGGLVGETRGDAGFSTTIDSCFNYATVENTSSGKKDIGGIAGKTAAYSVISRCGNYASVTSAGYMTGGIVGDALGDISDSFNAGSVTGNTYAMGGIAGYTGSDVAIDRCVNIADVKATGTYTGTYGTAGGVTGYGYAILTDCANYGNVEGSKTVGGIAGSKFGSFDIIRCVAAGEVSAPEGVTSVGNIFGSSVKFTGPVWFNDDINGKLSADNSSWIGLTTDSLMNLLPGENWTLESATYPLPTSLTEIAAVRFGAGRYLLKSGDTATNVTDDFLVASFPGLEWTSSDEEVIRIDGGKALVSVAKEKPVTLTLKWNGQSKSFDFIVNRTTVGIEVPTMIDIRDIEYYDMSGIRIKEPEKGQLYIRRSIMSDGRVKTNKVVY